MRNAKLFDNEKEVGHITSAVQSPALGCPIALGYVHRDYAALGVQVQIQDQSHGQTGTVTKLPFINP
jgi:aminomethyltransferase